MTLRQAVSLLFCSCSFFVPWYNRLTPSQKDELIRLLQSGLRVEKEKREVVEGKLNAIYARVGDLSAL